MNLYLRVGNICKFSENLQRCVIANARIVYYTVVVSSQLVCY